MLVMFSVITVILTNELVMATTEQCGVYKFKSPFYPGELCEDIYNKNPESHERSGYYWITDGPSKVYCGMTYTESSCEDIYVNNPEAGDKAGYYCINDKWTYCNMKEITAAGFIPTCAGMGGGWKRIVNIGISAGDDCPSGWRKDTHSNVSFCRVISDERRTCSSANFSINGTSYQRVCGRARGYQKGRTAAFFGYNYRGQTIDGWYAVGLLITYDCPRQHIWSYTMGYFDNLTEIHNCPCTVGGGSDSPSFVGTNYYCESGTNDTLRRSSYYFNDPLWDGSGCITSNCCNNPTQPWFYRELSGTTTSDIEARLCAHRQFIGGSPLIDQLELYIQ